jgi:hypothetical protein
MTKAQRDAEERERTDELQGRVEALIAAGAMSWVWPGTGEDGDSLPRNCFFTGLPVRTKQHPNAHKCNWTQLPGCANLRHKKRQRASMQRSGAKGPA